jgi:hypothetical protein
VKQVYMVVLDGYAHLHDGTASAYCKNWRQVRQLLRTDYRGCALKIYRRKWSLPYAHFWTTK